MTIHQTAMAVAHHEHGGKQINAAQATAAMHGFAKLISRMSLLQALCVTYRIRREKMQEKHHNDGTK